MHINNTSKPIRIKTWTLQSPISDDAVRFLHSLDIKVRAYPQNKEFDYLSNTYHYVGKQRIDIESTSEEQETMLKLKFGADLILTMDEIVLPNSMQVCTLSTLEF